MEELSLLVWLSRGNKKELIELMCKYTGLKPDTYSDDLIINLLQDTLIDVSRKYHLKNILYTYFAARRTGKSLIFFNPQRGNEMTVEIDALGCAMHSIQPKIFDEEDSNKIKELKKEYLEEVKK